MYVIENNLIPEVKVCSNISTVPISIGSPCCELEVLHSFLTKIEVKGVNIDITEKVRGLVKDGTLIISNEENREFLGLHEEFFIVIIYVIRKQKQAQQKQAQQKQTGESWMVKTACVKLDKNTYTLSSLESMQLLHVICIHHIPMKFKSWDLTTVFKNSSEGKSGLMFSNESITSAIGEQYAKLSKLIFMVYIKKKVEITTGVITTPPVSPEEVSSPPSKRRKLETSLSLDSIPDDIAFCQPMHALCFKILPANMIEIYGNLDYAASFLSAIGALRSSMHNTWYIADSPANRTKLYKFRCEQLTLKRIPRFTFESGCLYARVHFHVARDLLKRLGFVPVRHKPEWLFKAADKDKISHFENILKGLYYDEMLRNTWKIDVSDTTTTSSSSAAVPTIWDMMPLM